MADRLIVGCGYLGSRVAKMWRDRGDRVFVTTRSEERARQFERTGYHPISSNVLEPDTLLDLPVVDTCVYCIGFDRHSGHSMREIYVGGLSNFLNALTQEAAFPRRFIYVSSTSVYAQSDGEWVDESTETNPESGSGVIVLDAERRLRARLPEAIMVRFAGIYGPGRVMREQAIRDGKPIETDPEAWLNLIHVEDGARTILAAQQNARPGETYNVCDDEPIRRGDFYREVARCLNAPDPVFADSTHDRSGSRRIDNRRLHSELGINLTFPTYRDGLADALKIDE